MLKTPTLHNFAWFYITWALLNYILHLQMCSNSRLGGQKCKTWNKKGESVTPLELVLRSTVSKCTFRHFRKWINACIYTVHVCIYVLLQISTTYYYHFGDCKYIQLCYLLNYDCTSNQQVRETLQNERATKKAFAFS